MNRRSLAVALIVCIGLAAAGRSRGEDFEFADGDRVVLLGNTLIERAQRYGYWETRLVSAFPNTNLTVRNLGWSGDTVFGEARAGFGAPRDGFADLVRHVLALQPAVLLVGYGSNAAFEGDAGLSRFRGGLEDLLDALRPARARVVLLSPIKAEDLGPPLPDHAEYNVHLQAVCRVLREVARDRELDFVDLYGATSAGGPQWTDNGIHLSRYGYYHTAGQVAAALGAPPPRWRLQIEAAGEAPEAGKAVGTRVVHLARSVAGLRFTLRDDALPMPTPAPAAAGGPRLLRVGGLPAGRYTLRIDRQPVVAAEAGEWADGVALRSGPEFRQAEELRRAVVAKNRLYFYRWRPQNETYLFGFRKHEQGQNAREIPLFDSLVADQEAVIARLRVPQERYYELVRD